MPEEDFTDMLEKWTDIKMITLSLDTNAYAQNDVLADRQKVEQVTPVGGGGGVISSVVLKDFDDNGRAITLIFLDANVTIGVENSAVSISDANAAHIIGAVKITATDYVDMVNSQFADMRNVNMPFECRADSQNIYVAAIYRDATGDTYTASGIQVDIKLYRGM